MKHTAVLKTESKDVKSVSKALDVDNVKLDNLTIESKATGKHIVTRLESNNLHTLLNTLDDMISCQMVAEKLLYY